MSHKMRAIHITKIDKVYFWTVYYLFMLVS